MLRSTALATILTGVVTAAHAAGPAPTPVEPAVAQPAPVQSPFWAGGYVGGQLGYAYGDFDIGSGTSLSDFDDDSVIGGFHAGYLWEVSPGFYLGPEFQYDFADVTITDPDTGGTASFDEIARLKLIGGYEIGNGLLFGSAGIAYADFDSVGAVFDGFDGGESSYVLGLGYDHRVGDNWTVGGEYQFHRFNSAGASGEDVDVNTLHLRASYRF